MLSIHNFLCLNFLLSVGILFEICSAGLKMAMFCSAYIFKPRRCWAQLYSLTSFSDRPVVVS